MADERLLKRVRYFISDRLDLITGKRDPLTPPQRMIFVGPGDFVEMGKPFLGFSSSSEDSSRTTGCWMWVAELEEWLLL